MNPVLIPERFGCGLKLDFDELVALRRELNRPFGSDAANVLGISPATASSIDRVFQVGAEPFDFCRLALRHAAADLVAGGAAARFVSASFEFGPDLDIDARRTLTRAFFSAANERGINVGKCHSSTAPVTGMTLAIEGPVKARFKPLVTNGAVLLAGTLGGLERLYRIALEGRANPVDTVDEFNADQAGVLQVIPELCFCTDVSGYGLAGALWEFALGGPVSIEIDKPALESLSGTEEAPPPCLCVNLGDYGLPHLDERLQAFVSRREFCGPYILGCGGSEIDSVTDKLGQRNIPVRMLGRFQSGTSVVKIKH